MKTLRGICLLISISLLLSCSGSHDGDEALVYLTARVQHLLEAVGSETGIPGVSVYVISPGYGGLAFVWGHSDLEERSPVTPGDLFRVGSLTKSFTGAAVVRLTEEGLIDLSRPISDYLGRIDDYAPLDDISVGHLLNMSSGLAECLSASFLIGSVLPDPLGTHAPGELLAEAFGAAPELLFVPGRLWSYTNTNYILLGLLIEEVSELSYPDYLQEAFIGPLSLNDTLVITDSDLPEGLVRGYYDSDGEGGWEDWTQMHMSYVWSAGCIASTARDIAVWMRALARGSLVSQAFRPYLFEGISLAEGVVYGAGILVDHGIGIGHNGTVIGYHADAWHDPQTGTTVAVLCNTNTPLLSDERDPTREIAEGILALFD